MRADDNRHAGLCLLRTVDDGNAHFVEMLDHMAVVDDRSEGHHLASLPRSLLHRFVRGESVLAIKTFSAAAYAAFVIYWSCIENFILGTSADGTSHIS